MVSKDAGKYAHKLSKHMSKAQLTWQHTDEFAYGFRFHHKDNEDSVLNIKKRLSILLDYADDLPSDKHALAREIVKVAQASGTDLRSCTIAIRAQANVSHTSIERYRTHLVQAIKQQKPSKKVVLTSLTYRCMPKENSQLSRNRIFTVIEYMHWLQNPSQLLPIMWCSSGSNRFRKWN